MAPQIPPLHSKVGETLCYATWEGVGHLSGVANGRLNVGQF